MENFTWKLACSWASKFTNFTTTTNNNNNMALLQWIMKQPSIQWRQVRMFLKAEDVYSQMVWVSSLCLGCLHWPICHWKRAHGFGVFVTVFVVVGSGVLQDIHWVFPSASKPQSFFLMMAEEGWPSGVAWEALERLSRCPAVPHFLRQQKQ